jgi:glycosyltransferase involved in cell wall biosynthesis
MEMAVTATASVEQAEISLILCTYGPEHPLHLLLQSLVLQDCRFQLLIVDQNSDDRVPRLLEDYPALRYTLLRSNPGLSRARNVGLRHASASVIGFPDDDCAYPPRTLRSIVDFFSVAHDAGLYSGQTTFDIGVLEKTCTLPVPELLSIADFLRLSPSHTIFLDRRKLPQRAQWDIFDENLGVGAKFGAAEETDFVYVLMREGMKAYHTKGLLNYHPDKEVGLTNYRRATSYGLGAGAFFRKHLTLEPAFLRMAARAFFGPGIRTLQAAFGCNWEAAHYHARTLAARYQGFVTWPHSSEGGNRR